MGSTSRRGGELCAVIQGRVPYKPATFSISTLFFASWNGYIDYTIEEVGGDEREETHGEERKTMAMEGMTQKGILRMSLQACKSK